MNFSGWNSFEDFARACGYTNNTDDTMNNNSSTNESNKEACFDIPNGFQSLHPDLFVAIGGILGEIMAGNIPSNVQNALGNWFELLGQVILTYSAQQQYFQTGPGLYFNPKNFNINNPYCNTTSASSSSNSNTKSSTSSKKGSKNGKNSTDSKNKADKIDRLESRINELMDEMDRMKYIINNLKD